MKTPLESSTAQPQQPQGDAHVVTRARELDAFPRRLFAADMAAIYGVSLKTFYRQSREGAYDFALMRPAIGRPSWDRERVRQHFDGELRGLTVVRGRKRA